jgi:hypothetical protein
LEKGWDVGIGHAGLSSRVKAQRRDLTYSLRYIAPDGTRRVLMKATCAKCGEATEVNWGHGYDDRHVSRYWRNHGWDFHPHHKKSCICPDCKAKGVIMATPPVRPQPAPAPTPPPLNGGAPPKVEAPPPKLEAPAEPPAPLTREQRHNVRRALDNHFDDEIGRYAKDWSDKRIAEHLDIPLATVRELREAAYGPLVETDPEVLALREEHEQLKRDNEAQRQLLRDFDHKLINLERRHGRQ